jgi:hypothetical protein
MIYGGNMMSNFSGAINSQDNDMAKDVLLSEIHKVLDKNPEVLIDALNNSGIATPSTISKRELVHKVVEALYESEKFRNNISKIIIQGNEQESYNNGDGKGVSSIMEGVSKTGGGAASGGVVGAIAGAVDSIFGTIGKFKEGKNQKEADKNKLLASILEDKPKKTNYLPIIIISGVLLVGGIVAYVSLKEK